MKIACTGSEGQIGSRLLSAGVEPLFCDVRSQEWVRQQLHRVKPDVILHLAAHTSVDWCQANYEEAVAVNVFGTSALCQVAEEVIWKGRVVLISTDMVFDGKEGYYKEGDDPNPINNYGLSKFAAEGVAQIYDCKVIRISRCFYSKSKDISDYLLHLKDGDEIFVPFHMSRSYCHIDFMAELLFEYANRFDDMPEILHLGSAYPITFHAFMESIAIYFGYDMSLVYGRGEKDGYVPRPARTGLDVSLASELGFLVPTVNQSIERMKNEEHKNIVVILHYNKDELTKRLINGLFYEIDNIDEIVIVDNGSYQPVVPSGNLIRVERLEKNLGFTLGMNYGLEKTVGELAEKKLIFLISNDVQIHGKFIQQAEDILLGAKRALVGNRHIGWDSGWNTFNGRTFDYLEGYFLAMTSDGWKDVGFFDPSYAPFDYEDIDLSTTAKQKGYKLVSLNNPNIVHQGAGTLGYNPEREAITLRNKEYFRNKWVKE